jgi:hypothetical protein
MPIVGSLLRRAAARRSARRLLALLALSSLAVGCERKAPGPVECAEYAEAFVGVARDDEATTPHQQAAIDDVTQLCLTTPFDRELITCAQTTRRPRACFDAYKLRVRRPL